MENLPVHGDESVINNEDKPDKQVKEYNNGMFFIDGIRRIDFVLVYQRLNDTKSNQTKRLTFLKTLIKEGLEVEIQDDSGLLFPMKQTGYYDENDKESPSHRSNLVFIKIFASWDTLCRYAEVMKIRKPMLNLGIEYNFNRKTFFQRLFAAFDFLNVFNIDDSELPSLPRGFTWPFSKSKEYLFDITEDKSKFFTSTERSLIVNYILRRASYRHISDKGTIDATDLDFLEDIISKRNDIEMNVITNVIDENESQLDSSNLIADKPSQNMVKPLDERDSIKISMDFGIAKLISEGVFESAYILHERPLTEDDGRENVIHNERNLLYKHWVSMKNVFRLQPLDHIRLYFGEKIAFYFAWLGYYTYWLFPISLLGVIITIYSLIVTVNDVTVNEIRESKNVTMCPLMCSKKGCKFWKLSEAYYRFFMIRLLDNGATVVLAIVMSIWASLFLEMWKRQQCKLAYRWNVHDMEYEDEPPRPEFVALIDRKYPRKINLVSGKEEPFIPFWRQRIPVMFFTYSTVLLSIILALAFLGGIIVYKLVTFYLLRMTSNSMVSNLSSIITAATGSMISLIIIMILTLVYSRVAVWLTDLEHHRTQSLYDSSVTLKLYLLEFVNNYSSIFYIGFIQPYTQPIPSFKSTSVVKPRGCPAGGCLLDLAMQLAFIMIGKQIISHIKEYSIPRLCASIKAYKIKQSDKKMSDRRASDVPDVAVDDKKYEEEKLQVVVKDPNAAIDEKDYDIQRIEPELIRCYADNILADPGPRPLFGEYLEMLIQFGFITIFIPAFPLAPLLALINNLLEIRSDALKFVRALKRPVAQRVKDIGIWINILSVVAQIAVKSNAILIAFTTTYIEKFIFMHFYNSDRKLDGFTDFSLSYMNSSEFGLLYYSSRGPVKGTNDTYCRYQGFRYPPWDNENAYNYSPVFWQILAAKVIFVYLFENLVYLFMTVISVVIPDVPDKLRVSMKREAVLTNEIILKAELLRHKNQYASRMVAESFKKSAVLSQKVLY